MKVKIQIQEILSMHFVRIAILTKFLTNFVIIVEN